MMMMMMEWIKMIDDDGCLVILRWMLNINIIIITVLSIIKTKMRFVA